MRSRHAYPRKRKIRFRRVLVLGAALLALALAVGLGLGRHAGVTPQAVPPPEAGSLVKDPTAGKGAAPDPGGGTAGPAAKKADSPAIRAGHDPQSGMTPDRQDAPPPGMTPDRQDAPPPSGGSEERGGAGSSPERFAPPFAGLSLEQVSAAFARSYGGLTPKQWAENLPGVTRQLDPAGGPVSPPGSQSESSIAAATAQSGGGGRPTVALTLDACDGKKGASYDAGIIALLREKKIPATIFVTSLWMRNNPDVLRDLAADPLFEIAAHGSRHKPCSVNGKSVYGIKGTASLAELVREVEGNVREITAATGKRPRWFRSGTAYYDDVAVRVIRDLDLGLAGYSIAGDEGASLPASRVAARILAAKDGDILLCHVNHPRSGTREGLAGSLPALLEKGYVFVLLSPKR